MYVLTLYQEAEIRKFAVEKELATTEKIATMTDREVQNMVFKDYTPILLEYPQTDWKGFKRDFCLIQKNLLEMSTKSIPAERR